MRFSKTIPAFLVAGVLAMLSGAALADVPPGPRPQPPPRPVVDPKPDPAPAPPTGPSLVIKPTPGAKEATLEIPRKLLPGAEAPKAKADATGFSPTQTVVAGLAMTAAVTLLGLHLVRRRGRTPAMSLIGATVVVGVTGSVVLANLAPFPRERPKPPSENKVEWTPGQFGLRKVPLTIKVVEEGDDAVLSVDPSLLEPGPGAKPPVVQPNNVPLPPG
jgi:hypothetical protein